MAARSIGEREARIARVLRPLKAPLTNEQAKRAAQLLEVHWTTVYRLRRRFLPNPVASSLLRDTPGPRAEPRRLPSEGVIEDVLQNWLPRQRQLAHPVLDLHFEIRGRCSKLGLVAPSRNTIARRFEAYQRLQAELLEKDPASQIAPGSFVASAPLEIVQIDHTQADVFIVDRFTRRTIGRPWLSLAIDLATRCVVGFFVGMERPNAGTVALLISRIVQPKQEWLAHLELEIEPAERIHSFDGDRCMSESVGR